MNARLTNEQYLNLGLLGLLHLRSFMPNDLLRPLSTVYMTWRFVGLYPEAERMRFTRDPRMVLLVQRTAKIMKVDGLPTRAVQAELYRGCEEPLVACVTPANSLLNHARLLGPGCYPYLLTAQGGEQAETALPDLTRRFAAMMELSTFQAAWRANSRALGAGLGAKRGRSASSTTSEG